MKSIIVPVDFSRESGYALNFALQLREKNYKITVLHVIEFPVGGVVDPVAVAAVPSFDKEFLESLKKRGQERMDSFLEKVEGKQALDVRIEIGNAYATIADRISEGNHDLIVMGTKGASGFKAFFIGSNTEKVVRMASCPVIAVSKQTDVNNIRRIAFATSGLEVSEDLISHIKQLQDLFQATLHIVRINTPNNFEPDRLVLPTLQKLAERHMLKNYQLHVFNDTYEDQGIITFSGQINADIIAMGTHARKGLNHWFAGSLAEDVVNHAHGVIWTYHIKKA